MSKISIYFVRHGQTYFNLFHRIQGACDAHLTHKGIQDAKDAGKRLSHITFDKAYSSDLERAVNTAKFILRVNPSSINKPILDKAFREENFGYFEGMDIGFFAHTVGGPYGFDSYNGMIGKLGFDKTANLIAKADPYHLAESSNDMKKRFLPGLHRIERETKDGDKVLVTAHGSIIRWITSNFPRAHHFNIRNGLKNGSVTRMDVIDGKPKMVYFNNVNPIIR